jgi:hypothetical protein
MPEREILFDVKLICKACGSEQITTLERCLQHWPYCSNSPMSIIWLDAKCDVSSAINVAISKGRIWFDFVLSNNLISGLQLFAKGENCPIGLSCFEMLNKLDKQSIHCENLKQCLRIQSVIEEEPYEITFTD